MYFAVIRQHDVAWDRSRPLRDQQKWAEHAAFMDLLFADGFVVLAGALGDDAALLIIDADSEEAVHARLNADPWTPMELLTTARIDRWEILLGDITMR